VGGFFGVASKEDCVKDLYFGTDYHSHLGTSHGGMAVWNGKNFLKSNHRIETTQFRVRFEPELVKLKGSLGIGSISDTDSQPLTVFSHHGHYALSTVGKINNAGKLVEKAFANGNIHFLGASKGVDPTELVSTIIDNEGNFKDGLLKVQELIQGSCSVLLLTPKGIYASRDKLGRMPVIIGKKEGSYCATFESCTLSNLGYRFHYELGPGEIVFVTPEGVEKISPPRDKMQICAFLWIYYGYPSSTYEGMNVEAVRYRNGAAIAKNDNIEVDIVAGIPDSGIGHAIGYSNQSKAPYGRPFIKYTPTWARSFMPQNQDIRNLVAKMKLMPISELVSGKRLLFMDDSIVRGTQLRETVNLLYKCKAKEVHMRSACPPIVFGCRYLNFSASHSEMELAARQAIHKLEGKMPENLDAYCDPKTEQYSRMVDSISRHLNFSTLKYQNIHDMVDCIGIGQEKTCTYCWNGKE